MDRFVREKEQNVNDNASLKRTSSFKVIFNM